MKNQDLIDQFARCEKWQDADQWDALGMLYFNCGCILNAGVCFQKADACRCTSAPILINSLVAMETVTI